MSGLEALSLACNVMTVIDFALNTVNVCRSIRETGSPDKGFEENTRNVEKTLNNMQHVLQQQPTAPTAAEIDLRGLAAKCMEHNEAVQKELEYISPKANRGLSAVLGSTFKTIKRKSHLNDLKGHLEAARKTLATALAVRILEECINSKALTSATYSTLDQQHKAFLANYKQILDTIFAEFDATRETQAYETLLNSLRYDSMNDRKNSIPERHRETFEWIFEEEQELADPITTHSTDNPEGAGTPGDNEDNVTLVKFQEEKATQEPKTHAGLMAWLQRDENCLYWVSGKPGSGKSTFMKFIEKDNRTKEALRSWQPQCNIISHYLWKPGTSSQQSLKGLLCSLLYQVLSLERSIAIRLLSEIPNLSYKRAYTDWDIYDVRDLLFRGLHDSSYAYLILLDGLDELAEPHGGLNELFCLLSRLVTADGVKLCVSSRPEESFAAKFAPNPSIRMQDLTFLDIWRYTADTLKELQLDPGDELYKKIHTIISFKAEGVFIWVYLVLSRVKIGIEKYYENWGDIYDRIIMMPADLMQLYKDMWSRLDGNNEKYTKKAARYFQCVRFQEVIFHPALLAKIALFADDQRLEEFTRPDGVPSVEEIVKMSQVTMETLFQVSAGLLEVQPSIRRGPDNPGPKDVAGYNEIAHRWDTMRVEFIHRTAIDFLESDEGKDIFDRYTLGPIECFLQGAKVELAIRSSYHVKGKPLFPILTFMQLAFQKSTNMKSLAACNSLLSTVHRCALNKSRGLLRPPPWISFENFFLFEVATRGFYEYAEERIRISQDSDSTASIYTLIGACVCYYAIDFSIEGRIRFDKRYSLIRDILKEYVKSNIGTLGPSAVRAARDNIMLAWRCFLLHELSPNENIRRKDDQMQLIEEIIELFIEAGVMADSPAPRYLVAVLHLKSGDERLKIVQRLHGMLWSQRPSGFAPTIYMELNDAFLLRRLSQMISGTSELISIQESNAFMRPVLVDNGTEKQLEGGPARFFHLTVNDEDMESSTGWIFGNELGFDRDFFPNEKPDFIQAVDLGILPHAVDALDKIGYQLSEVNRDGGYECLHEWF